MILVPSPWAMQPRTRFTPLRYTIYGLIFSGAHPSISVPILYFCLPTPTCGHLLTTGHLEHQAVWTFNPVPTLGAIVECIARDAPALDSKQN